MLSTPRTGSVENTSFRQNVPAETLRVRTQKSSLILFPKIATLLLNTLNLLAPTSANFSFSAYAHRVITPVGNVLLLQKLTHCIKIIHEPASSQHIVVDKYDLEFALDLNFHFGAAWDLD